MSVVHFGPIKPANVAVIVSRRRRRVWLLFSFSPIDREGRCRGLKVLTLVACCGAGCTCEIMVKMFLSRRTNLRRRSGLLHCPRQSLLPLCMLGEETAGRRRGRMGNVEGGRVAVDDLIQIVWEVQSWEVLWKRSIVRRIQSLFGKCDLNVGVRRGRVE